jgi:nitrite reductase/ring-hydroxylating ferredoxin subunit
MVESLFHAPDIECRCPAGIAVAYVMAEAGEWLYALADRSAHLGGPFSEGHVDSGSIRCPWHGSRFALDDSRVLEGPSTFTQPCFEIRVRDGQVEVPARD